MYFDQSEFNELATRAAALTRDIADVPRLLRARLGPGHDLAQSAEEMLNTLEQLVHALRSYTGAEPQHMSSSEGRGA